MYLATLEINKPYWDAFRKELKTLPIYARLAGTVAMERIATDFAMHVQRRYTVFKSPPIKPSTLERRTYGKPKATKGTAPLFRTGSLVKTVYLKIQPTGYGMRGSVGIRPNVRLRGGGISDKVARVLETGQPSYTITITDKMMNYLRYLLKKSGRYDEVMSKATQGKGGKIIGAPVARPVWGPAVAVLNKMQPLDFFNKFLRELNRHTKLLHFTKIK